MPRIARVMAAGWRFHLTHRGNHKKPIFYTDRDRRRYLGLFRHYAGRFGMAVWAYCLMDNHVHVLAVGLKKHSIPMALGNAHREHSRRLNVERKVTGHLWANRYFSTALDETHLWAAVRYVELNPVRANIVTDPTEYRWSSARAHAGLVKDNLLDPERPFPGPISGWKAWLEQGLEEETVRRLRRNTATGQPTGSEEFVAAIERQLGRQLRIPKVRPRRG